MNTRQLSDRSSMLRADTACPGTALHLLNGNPKLLWDTRMLFRTWHHGESAIPRLKTWHFQGLFRSRQKGVPSTHPSSITCSKITNQAKLKNETLLASWRGCTLISNKMSNAGGRQDILMLLEESIRIWNPHMLLPWPALLTLPPHGGAPAARAGHLHPAASAIRRRLCIWGFSNERSRAL